ncbi:rhamnulokinase family protein [Nocardioides sp. CFH 31398]|uniref:rhamnulokinase n=1 Tax=Nocardioides sp. CFH 31398 TaxID=2919579 RepID=UPI001F0651E0|nr:rhamnulokinase family protein [Nocardioides sp. CFH 31398]MCH1867735.1 rhamnulokinase [Nocardioides sp. CFH 31398]
MAGPAGVTVAAVDLGASSGRVVVGRAGPGGVDLEVVHRFANDPVRLPDGLHWDLLGLYREVLVGLRRAAAHDPVSVGIDSWAVDYGLLRDGRLLGMPYTYRDARTARGVRAVHDVVAPEELYARNGLQHLDFNTVFQLVTEGPLLQEADTALLVPDLLGHWLTGVRVAERTNASTTGLLGLDDGGWDAELCERVGVPTGLLPPLVDPGERLGPLLPHVRAATGLLDGVDLVAVGSHDTASAVAGTPLSADGAAYLSLGTWGLVGVETTAAVPPGPARAANLTHERGVDGTFRVLRNVMGTWILSRLLDAWRSQGRDADLPRLLGQAAALPDRVVAGLPALDVDDPSFTAPDDMAAAVAAWLVGRGEAVPVEPAETVRMVCEGLAAAYARVLRDLAEVTGRAVPAVHVTGGGSRNGLVCDLLAARAGVPVHAGPVEATALGNVLVQARAHGAFGDGASLADLRSAVATTHPPRTHHPSG